MTLFSRNMAYMRILSGVSHCQTRVGWGKQAIF